LNQLLSELASSAACNCHLHWQQPTHNWHKDKQQQQQHSSNSCLST